MQASVLQSVNVYSNVVIASHAAYSTALLHIMCPLVFLEFIAKNYFVLASIYSTPVVYKSHFTLVSTRKGCYTEIKFIHHV